MKWLKRKFCRHKHHRQITIHDWYHDFITDNDDLEDVPTYIIVTYCPNCGKVISKAITYFYNSEEIQQQYEIENPPSSKEEINEFEKITGLKARDISILAKRSFKL